MKTDISFNISHKKPQKRKRETYVLFCSNTIFFRKNQDQVFSDLCVLSHISPCGAGRGARWVVSFSFFY